jgi:hypothetical protein
MGRRKEPPANVDNAVDNSGDDSGVTLVAQRHGGALLPGGRRGNRGGPGKLPSRVRQASLAAFAQRLPVLKGIADGVVVEIDEQGAYRVASPTPRDRVAALKVLAELGLGAQVHAADVRERLTAQLQVIRSRPTWTADELVAALAKVWG